MFSLVVMPVFKGLTPEDQKYFREAREAALGMTLEKASQKTFLLCPASLYLAVAIFLSAVHSSNICQSFLLLRGSKNSM